MTVLEPEQFIRMADIRIDNLELALKLAEEDRRQLQAEMRYITSWIIALAAVKLLQWLALLVVVTL